MPTKPVGANPVYITGHPLPELDLCLARTPVRIGEHAHVLLSVGLTRPGADQPVACAIYDEIRFRDALGHLYPHGELAFAHKHELPAPVPLPTAMNLLPLTAQECRWLFELLPINNPFTAVLRARLLGLPHHVKE